jgi:hypothetical protein
MDARLMYAYSARRWPEIAGQYERVEQIVSLIHAPDDRASKSQQTD